MSSVERINKFMSVVLSCCPLQDTCRRETIQVIDRAIAGMQFVAASPCLVKRFPSYGKRVVVECTKGLGRPAGAAAVFLGRGLLMDSCPKMDVRTVRQMEVPKFGFLVWGIRRSMHG